jgi:hypothetical protein
LSPGGSAIASTGSALERCCSIRSALGSWDPRRCIRPPPTVRCASSRSFVAKPDKAEQSRTKPDNPFQDRTHAHNVTVACTALHDGAVEGARVRAIGTKKRLLTFPPRMDEYPNHPWRSGPFWAGRRSRLQDRRGLTPSDATCRGRLLFAVRPSRPCFLGVMPRPIARGARM